METSVTAAFEPSLSHLAVGLGTVTLGASSGRMRATLLEAAGGGELVLAVTHAPSGRVYQLPVAVDSLIDDAAGSRRGAPLAPPHSTITDAPFSTPPSHPLPLTERDDMPPVAVRWLHHWFSVPTTASSHSSPSVAPASRPEFFAELVRRNPGHYRVAVATSIRDPISEDLPCELQTWPAGAKSSSKSSKPSDHVSSCRVALYDARALRKRASKKTTGSAGPTPYGSLEASAMVPVSASPSSTAAPALDPVAFVVFHWRHAIPPPPPLSSSPRPALRQSLLPVRLRHTLKFSGTVPPNLLRFADTARRAVAEHVVACDITAYLPAACDSAGSGAWVTFPIFGDEAATVEAATRAFQPAPNSRNPSELGGARRIYGELLNANLASLPSSSKGSSASGDVTATVLSQRQSLPFAADRPTLVALRLVTLLRQTYDEWLEDTQGSGTGAEEERNLTSRIAAVGVLRLDGARPPPPCPLDTKPSVDQQLSRLYADLFRWSASSELGKTSSAAGADAASEQVESTAASLTCRMTVEVVFETEAARQSNGSNVCVTSSDPATAAAVERLNATAAYMVQRAVGARNILDGLARRRHQQQTGEGDFADSVPSEAADETGANDSASFFDVSAAKRWLNMPGALEAIAAAVTGKPAGPADSTMHESASFASAASAAGLRGAHKDTSYVVKSTQREFSQVAQGVTALKAVLASGSLALRFESNPSTEEIGSVFNVHPATMHYMYTLAAYVLHSGRGAANAGGYDVFRFEKHHGVDTGDDPERQLVLAARVASALQCASADQEAQPAADYTLRAQDHMLTWAAADLASALSMALPTIAAFVFVARVVQTVRRSWVLTATTFALWVAACLQPAAGVPALVSVYAFVALSLHGKPSQLLRVAPASTRPSPENPASALAEYRASQAAEANEAAAAKGVAAMSLASRALVDVGLACSTLFDSPRVVVLRLFAAVAAAIAISATPPSGADVDHHLKWMIAVVGVVLFGQLPRPFPRASKRAIA
jgi:hypothetical protein